MIGSDHLVAMRKRRMVPSRGVLLQLRGPLPKRQWQQPFDDTACLYVQDGERFDKLDLRCVVGLKVLCWAAVGDATAGELESLAKCCTKAGAARVGHALFEDDAQWQT